MTKQQLVHLCVTKPPFSSTEHVQLKESMESYPYSTLLHVLYARNLPDTVGHESLKKALAYANEQILQRARLFTEYPIEPTPVEVHLPKNTVIEVVTPPLVIVENKEIQPKLPTETTKKADSFFSLDTSSVIEKFAVESEETTVAESFTDWLKKTNKNKENSDSFGLKLDTSTPIESGTVDELEKLYLENSYQLQLLDEQTIPNNAGDSLIDKFIKEEPQLKPTNTTLANTENKAKKSAELPDELITETLAQIYVTQKIYSKAIAAYEKLSFKIPKKSAYFASLIQKLKSDNQLT